MMVKSAKDSREQIQFVSTEGLVPEKHLLRDIEKAVDFSFIYELVEEMYSKDIGRPSIDPVMLLKIPFLQYLYGIQSMRATIKEIEVNVAFRWFLGLGLTDPVPHFSTFGKNYTRRFKGTSLFEQIFAKILQECFDADLVDTGVLFVDATHIKANANKKKFVKEMVSVQAMHYEKQLKEEIQKDRAEHGKRPLKDNDEDDDEGYGSGEAEQKQAVISTTDPESGMFHKGEHKKEFAYVSQTVCDKNGWIVAYSIHPGNVHDSRSFKTIYEKMKKYDPKMLVMDAGYKTPAIAKVLLDDNVIPVLPYRQPMTKEGFFKKHEFAYDEYYDCYICPDSKILAYSTTNRDGYKEYKSNPKECTQCSMLQKCTHSKNCQKIVTRHIWEAYMEICEDIRHTQGMKELYGRRKETIERIFGTAKEYNGFRYTRYKGKELMTMKVAMTFACMNLKKLAKMKRGQYGTRLTSNFTSFLLRLQLIISNIWEKPSACCI